MITMEANELINELGKRLGIELELEEGACTIMAGDLFVTMNAFSELDAIVLTGDLGEPQPENLENLYKTMLEANHLFNGTAGATLSLNHETNCFSLCKALPCRLMDIDSFYAEIERFVNTLEVWSKLVQNYRGNGADEQSNSTAPSFDSNGFIRV